MAIPVSYLVDDAAIAIGDPNRTRVKTVEWQSFFNRACRELSSKADVMQRRALFTLGDQAAYHWPDDMRRATGIEVSETPDDEDSWRQLNEIFESEHRGMVSGYYSNTTLPESYFATVLGFFLYPRPSAEIVNGGRITYFGHADRVLDIDTATFELLEIAQDHVLKRMIIFGLRARNRHAEADAEMTQWLVDVEGLQDALEDRSDDRRSSLMPRRDRFSGHR